MVEFDLHSGWLILVLIVVLWLKRKDEIRFDRLASLRFLIHLCEKYRFQEP